MTAVRGSRDLYNEWAILVGPQWSYRSIRPLFKRNETYTGDTEVPNERGTEGPIYIRQQIIPQNGINDILAEATSIILDIPIVEDYNTGIGDCTSTKVQLTQKEIDGAFIRSSTTTSYLNKRIVTQGNEEDSIERGVRGRKLLIYTKTTVDKIYLMSAMK